MYRDSVAAAIRRQPLRRYVVWITLLLALVFFTSVVSAELRFPGASTAPWWPAAGISVFTVFASRGRGLDLAALIMLVTAWANLMAGTTWWVAIGFGFANAVEAWLVVAIVQFRRVPGHRFRNADSIRFIIATAAGAAVVGPLVGAIVALDGGNLIETAAHVAASHGSSVLLIGMLAVLPRPSFIPTRPVELLFQVLLLGAVVFVALGAPRLPLAFLSFPVIAWAAFRFRAGVTLIEVLLLSVAATVMSFLGVGTFATVAAGDGELLIGLVQIFSISLGISMLPLAIAQDDRTDLYLRLSAREQLLRGAIVSANAGFIVVRHDADGAYRVVESNPNGERMLAPWLAVNAGATVVDGARLAELAESDNAGAATHVEFPDGTHVELTATPLEGDSTVLLIQALDITEQTKAARALADAFVHEKEAADRLRTLSAQKDEFISSVSHELRTPVTSILGYSEELGEADLPESERRSVEIIMRNAKRLADLVEDLLNVSREAGLTSTTAAPIELRAAVSDCVVDLTAIADRARVTVDVESGDDAVVAGDRLALDRVLVNLLANAIKFTPPGGRIDISLSRVDDGFARVDKVFERFYRVPSEKEFVAGTGLGLPIVRDLVTRMGGRVALRSDGTTGTTAVLDMPLHAGD
jgi:two-component system phosphate regulon sensor histidine kinase PhoR